MVKMSALPKRQNQNSSFNEKKTKTIHQANKRRKKRKTRGYSLELHEKECDHGKGVKRKSDDVLENDCFSDVLDSLLKQANDVPIKRPRNNPQSSEAKSVVSLFDSLDVDSGISSEISPATSGRSSPCERICQANIVAMDCEMVGTGPGGRCNELARCSIINYHGSVIYDKYILPVQKVTNYRTRWSGIRKHHLVNAEPFEKAQNEIVNILKGKVIIGHSLNNDFEVLDIFVPARMVRDTSSCLLLRELYEASIRYRVSLKKLSEKLLHRAIQVGREGHCSVQDACAALDLYKLVEDQWEKDLSNPRRGHASYSNRSLEHYMQDQYWPECVME